MYIPGKTLSVFYVQVDNWADTPYEINIAGGTLNWANTTKSGGVAGNVATIYNVATLKDDSYRNALTLCIQRWMKFYGNDSDAVSALHAVSELTWRYQFLPTRDGNTADLAFRLGGATDAETGITNGTALGYVGTTLAAAGQLIAAQTTPTGMRTSNGVAGTINSSSGVVDTLGLCYNQPLMDIGVMSGMFKPEESLTVYIPDGGYNLALAGLTLSAMKTVGCDIHLQRVGMSESFTHFSQVGIASGPRAIEKYTNLLNMAQLGQTSFGGLRYNFGCTKTAVGPLFNTALTFSGNDPAKVQSLARIPTAFWHILLGGSSIYKNSRGCNVYPWLKDHLRPSGDKCVRRTDLGAVAQNGLIFNVGRVSSFEDVLAWINTLCVGTFSTVIQDLTGLYVTNGNVVINYKNHYTHPCSARADAVHYRLVVPASDFGNITPNSEIMYGDVPTPVIMYHDGSVRSVGLVTDQEKSDLLTRRQDVLSPLRIIDTHEEMTS